MLSVTGAALSEYNRRKDGTTFRDWAAEAYNEALGMSGLDPVDIDMLVVATESDCLTGQLNPAGLMAAELGLGGRTAMRIEGGGASGQLAVHAAVNAIRSGTVRHAAVVGFDQCASLLEADSVRDLYGSSFDAWQEGFSSVTPTALYALSAQMFMREHGLEERHLDMVAVQNRQNAAKNPKAHLGREHTEKEVSESEPIALPYRKLHCSPLSDGAAAVILSHEKCVPRSRMRAPEIRGIGSGSDRTTLGSRYSPHRFVAKEIAVSEAYAQARITPFHIDFAEVYDAYAGAQLQALHSLRLTDDVRKDLEEGRFSPDGERPVNLTGGLMGLGAPAGAIGVGQTASCALMLEGRHPSPLRPSFPFDVALADTHGGLCSVSAVTILTSAGWIR